MKIFYLGLHPSNRIASISFTVKGKVVFEEECDVYFNATIEPDEAIEHLEEAIKFIKDNKV